MEFLKDFLSHEDPNIRAKACSALGNMCRHSSYFYGSLVSCEMQITITFVVVLCGFIFYLTVSSFVSSVLNLSCWNLQERYEIINLLIDRCSDLDKRTRKFACFAVSFVLPHYCFLIGLKSFEYLHLKLANALSLLIKLPVCLENCILELRAITNLFSQMHEIMIFWVTTFFLYFFKIK